MKKSLFMLLCIGGLMFALAGCGGKADEKADGSSQESSSSESSSPESMESSSEIQESGQEPGQSSGPQAAESGEAGGQDDSAGWTEEMSAVRDAVAEALGEEYWPDMALDPELLEMYFGLTDDMYEDYLAEMPMISANVDTLVVVKPKEGQADAVEEALTAYRESKVNDTMQYPINVGQIEASRVEKIGDYVCFVQLGGDTQDAFEEGGDAAVVEHCQELNERVVGILQEQLEDK